MVNILWRRSKHMVQNNLLSTFIHQWNVRQNIAIQTTHDIAKLFIINIHQAMKRQAKHYYSDYSWHAKIVYYQHSSSNFSVCEQPMTKVLVWQSQWSQCSKYICTRQIQDKASIFIIIRFLIPVLTFVLDANWKVCTLICNPIP